jgi:hypothetical protein
MSPVLLHLIFISLLYRHMRLDARDCAEILEARGDSHERARALAAPLEVEGRDYASLAHARLHFEGWRTIPDEAARLRACIELAGLFDLRGAPGFYVDGTRWRINLNLRRGLVRPYRDPQHRIYGLRVYRSAFDREPFLLSSRGLKCGTRAARPV